MMLGSSFFLGLKGPLLGAAIWAAYKYYSHGVAPKELATVLYLCTPGAVSSQGQYPAALRAVCSSLALKCSAQLSRVYAWFSSGAD